MARSKSELRAIHAKQKFRASTGDVFTRSEIEDDIIRITNEILGANKLKSTKLESVNKENDNVKADTQFSKLDKKDISKLRNAGFNISNRREFTPNVIRADLMIDSKKARKFLKNPAPDIFPELK